MTLDDIFANIADQDKGRELALVDPVVGAPTGIKLTVVGPDSDTARRARLRLMDDMAEMAGLDGTVKAEHRDDIRRKYLAALVLDWSAEEGGQAVPFSTANMLRILRARWVEEQLDAFAADRRNFAPINYRRVPLMSTHPGDDMIRDTLIPVERR